MNDYQRAKLTDEELCILCQGTDGASEELIRRYTGFVRRYARPYYLAGADWEDLLQEGFLGLLNAINCYQPGSDASFKTYATSCVRNKIISSIRAASKQNHRILSEALSLDVSGPLEFDRQHLLQASVSPEQVMMDQEDFEELKTILTTSLSTLEQQTLDLFLQGLSYREIAERMGKTTKSVDNAVQRIRTKLMRERNLA